MFVSLAAVPILLAAAPQGPALWPREWVVKDVQSAPIHPNVERSVLDSTWRMGDVDRDGLPELSAEWRGQALNNAWLHGTRVAEGLLLDTRIDYPLRTVVSFTYHAHEILATPVGPQYVMRESNAKLEFRDAASGLLTRTLTVGFGIQLRGAGDVDSDGWEDFFLVLDAGSALTVQACSGVDGSALWTSTMSSAVFSVMPESFAPGPQPDLDGDGVSDLVIRYQSDAGTAGDWGVVAFSGVDGATLWNRTGPRIPGGGHPQAYLLVGPDWTGDGVADVVATWPSLMIALDGANGTVLWQLPTMQLQAWFPNPSAQMYPSLEDMPMLTPSPTGSGAIELVLPVREVDNLLPWLSETALYHLDAATGTVLERMPLSGMTAAPFGNMALFGPGSVTVFSFLGDLDRDGFGDWAHPILEPATATLPERWSLAFFAPRTLRGPASASIGSAVGFELMLPGAAGRPYALLASRSFDATGGARFQGWRTHLDAPLIAGTGQLDATGRDGVVVQLPANPALIGAELWLRAAVPTTGASDLHTLSTLSQLDVLP